MSFLTITASSVWKGVCYAWLVFFPLSPMTIRRSMILAFSTLLILAACGKAPADRAAENAIEKETGGTADINSRDGTVHVETSEGTYDAGSNTLPTDWPSDAPTYPGAEIQYSASMNPTTGKQGAMVVLQTSESAEKVLAYYKTQLQSQGWSIEGTMSAGGSTTLAAKKGERVLSLIVSDAEGKTAVTLAVGEEQ